MSLHGHRILVIGRQVRSTVGSPLPPEPMRRSHTTLGGTAPQNAGDAAAQGLPQRRATARRTSRPARHPRAVRPRRRRGCRRPGANAVHLHAKDADGADTLRPAELVAVLTAVRAAAPGLPVGVTTGAWAEPDPDARAALIDAWDRPSRLRLGQLARGRRQRAGRRGPAGARRRRGGRVVARRCRPGVVALARARTLPARARRAPRRGTGRRGGRGAARPPRHRRSRPARAAGRRSCCTARTAAPGRCWRSRPAGGLATRIGLEDALALPDGSPAPDNPALVRAARELLTGPAGGPSTDACPAAPPGRRLP